MRFNLRRKYLNLSVPPYKRRALATVLTLGAFLLLFLSSLYVVDFRIRPTVKNLAAAKARQIAIEAVNEGIRANVLPGINYQQLMTVNFDQQGKVALMQPNAGEINRISVAATLAVQQRLRELPKMMVKVPVGQILGIKFLAGLGPELPVEVRPIGVVNSQIRESFDVAGINQIRHRIFLSVETTIQMAVPFVNHQVEISAQIPLVEAVVMGEVPEIYVEGNGTGLILPGNLGSIDASKVEGGN